MNLILIKFKILTIVIWHRHSRAEAQKFTTKCCPITKIPDGDECKESNITFKPIFWPTYINDNNDNINITFGNPCKYGRYLMEEGIYSEFFVLHNGTLYLPNDKQLLSADQYCLDTFFIQEKAIILPLVCFPKPKCSEYWQKLVIFVLPYGLFVSSLFMAISVLLEIQKQNKFNTINRFHHYFLYLHTCLIISSTTLATRHVTDQIMANTNAAIEFILQSSYMTSLLIVAVITYESWKNFKRNNTNNNIIDKYISKINSINVAICMFLIQGIIFYIIGWSSVLPTIFLLYSETESSSMHYLRISIYKVFVGLLLLGIGYLLAVIITKDENKENAKTQETSQKLYCKYQLNKNVLAFSLMAFHWLLEVFGIPNSNVAFNIWITLILLTYLTYSIILLLLSAFYTRRLTAVDNRQTEITSNCLLN
ncbi:uncharacterized protein LOC126843403 isoform X2 [Adelges cooleyi]|uniref:uncharacterized protein LOC126843403 isoform X2 n=1 Tax=Adelges cooleyi TaxID=133065 RepID=UPI0021807CBF|nr:uncharacterized protein LOC126843403 isoform X2 [Adelges cooleyi]